MRFIMHNSHNRPITLQLRLWPLVQQVIHLPPGPVGVQAGCRSFTVPSPLLLEFRREVVFEHLDDVFAEDGEELVAVERPACCDEEALGASVW